MRNETRVKERSASLKLDDHSDARKVTLTDDSEYVEVMKGTNWFYDVVPKFQSPGTSKPPTVTVNFKRGYYDEETGKKVKAHVEKYRSLFLSDDTVIEYADYNPEENRNIDADWHAGLYR